MSLRDMVRSYSSGSATATAATVATVATVATPTREVNSDYQGSATATPATPATYSGLTVARVATVAVATRSDEKERVAKRWRWFLSLAMKHGINPNVVGAEFTSESDRLDVIEPAEHNDELLRECMATLCRDTRVQRRQREYAAGRWVPDVT